MYVIWYSHGKAMFEEKFYSVPPSERSSHHILGHAFFTTQYLFGKKLLLSYNFINPAVILDINKTAYTDVTSCILYEISTLHRVFKDMIIGYACHMTLRTQGDTREKYIVKYWIGDFKKAKGNRVPEKIFNVVARSQILNRLY